MTGIVERLEAVKRLWRSEAFWFGFWEMLALRVIFDPKGHRQRFIELLNRSRSRALRKDEGDHG